MKKEKTVPPILRRALANAQPTVDGQPAFRMPPGAEGDTTGEYNVIGGSPQLFADELTHGAQPGGEGGCTPG